MFLIQIVSSIIENVAIQTRWSYYVFDTDCIECHRKCSNLNQMVILCLVLHIREPLSGSSQLGDYAAF